MYPNSCTPTCLNVPYLTHLLSSHDPTCLYAPQLLPTLWVPVHLYLPHMPHASLFTPMCSYFMYPNHPYIPHTLCTSYVPVPYVSLHTPMGFYLIHSYAPSCTSMCPTHPYLTHLCGLRFLFGSCSPTQPIILLGLLYLICLKP